MPTETQSLINACENFVDRIKKAQQKKKTLIKPREPSSEPSYPHKPSLEKTEKPLFFENLLVIGICYLIPSFIVIRVMFDNSNHSYYLITAAILTLLTLAYNYSSGMDLYRSKVKTNEIKTREYERQLEEYRFKKQKYDKALSEYNKLFEEYEEKRKAFFSEEKSCKNNLATLLKIRESDSSEKEQLKTELQSTYKEYLPNELFSNLANSLRSSPGIHTHTTYPHDYSGYYSKADSYFSGVGSKTRTKILTALKEVQRIQKSQISDKQKVSEIKDVLWTNQSFKSRLAIGGFLGAVLGLTIFGTGGVGIAALGGAVGVWGWFLTSVGGAVVASIITNFEKK